MKIEQYRVDPYPASKQLSEKNKQLNISTADAVSLDPDSRRKKQEESKQRKKNTKNESESLDTVHVPYKGESDVGHLDVVV